jgi:hypothetical protein
VPRTSPRTSSFDALDAVAAEAGLEGGHVSLARFLLDAGILDVLGGTPADDAARYLPLAAEANRLLSPAEMGELFRGRGVGPAGLAPDRGRRAMLTANVASPLAQRGRARRARPPASRASAGRGWCRAALHLDRQHAGGEGRQRGRHAGPRWSAARVMPLLVARSSGPRVLQRPHLRLLRMLPGRGTAAEPGVVGQVDQQRGVAACTAATSSANTSSSRRS